MIAAAWRSSDSALLATVLILLSFSGFFALAETSLVRMTRTKASALATAKKRGSAALVRLAAAPDKFLNPLLLLILVCQLVSATLVGVLAEHLFGTAGLIVATTFEVVVIFVIFEAIPKNLAVQHANRSALVAAPIVEAILKFWPIKWVSVVLLSIANFVLRPFGSSEDAHKVTESEIIAMANVAADDKAIDKKEKEFIHSVLELGDTIVREVMVPRVDIVEVSSTDSVNVAVARAVESGKTRLPVLGESIDDVVGVANLHWLLRMQRAGKGDDTLASIGIPEAIFVPETRKLSSMLEALQKGKNHLYIVVDEYGGTAGIVTLEDLLEELIGEIFDESDPEEPEDEEKPKPVAENGGLLVDGRLNVEDVNDDFGLTLPLGSWDTVAGLVLDLAGGVPEVGETFQAGPYEVRVEKMDRHRVEQVSVTALVGDE